MGGVNSLNPKHPMSDLATQHALKFLALTIWKLRRHCPNLAIEITLQDMEALMRAFSHGGQQPVVAFIGKANSVTVQLVDAQSGRQLVIEKGDENSPNAKGMRKMLDARARAQSVADRLLVFGGPDPALLREAADILKTLTWEPTE